MRQGQRLFLPLLVVCCFAVAGCRHRGEPLRYVGGAGDYDYRAHATQVSYPHVAAEVQPAAFTDAPFVPGDEREFDLWDMSLQEALHIAIANNDFIRSAGTFLSPSNPLLTNPQLAPSTLDVALQESGVLFGNRGVEAALSDFDTQFTTRMIWGRNEQIQNNPLTSGGVPAGTTLREESADFLVGLEKSFAGGGSIGLIHDWNYSGTNAAARLFPSVYTGSLRAEFRQPLLAGGGVEYTRIAGPVGSNIQGVSGVSQGVVIAKIDSDMAVADLETAVAGLIHDVETLYWQLHLAYRVHDSQVAALEEAREHWEIMRHQARVEVGRIGAADEAEAYETYLRIAGFKEDSLEDLLHREGELRRLLGLPVHDGLVIRPADEPMVAEVSFDWGHCLATGFMRRPELRKQQWQIKSLELQLRAARNLTLPRLDLVSSYRLNAFGDDLAGPSDDGVTNLNLGSAYSSLANGDETGWTLGVEMSVPIGRRYALTQVRNQEFQLAKARAALEEQQAEVSHEMAATFRRVASSHSRLERDWERLDAALVRHGAVQADYLRDSMRVPLREVTRARESLSQAEITLASSLIEYNLAVVDLHFRMGRILDLDNITMAEGPWAPPAYDNARDHADARAHAIPDPIRGVAPLY